MLKKIYATIILLSLSVCLANAQTFDEIPEGSEQVFLRLQSNFYPVFTNGPQSFVTPEGNVYVPLTILHYLILDTEQFVVRPEERRFGFYTTRSVHVSVSLQEDGSTLLNVGGAGSNINPIWLEEDVYLPIRPFLSALNIDYMWDSVLRLLIIPNAAPIQTTEFALWRRTSVKDIYPVNGVFTNAITPTEISLSGGSGIDDYLYVTIRALIDIPVGVNLVTTSGSRVKSGTYFDTCSPEACNFSTLLANYRNIDENNIILVEILAANKRE